MRVSPRDRLLAALAERVRARQPAGDLCVTIWRRAATRAPAEVWLTATTLAPLGLQDPTALKASLAASAVLVALAPGDEQWWALREALLAAAGRPAEPRPRGRDARAGCARGTGGVPQDPWND